MALPSQVAAAAFQHWFGQLPAITAAAPGRVNLLGEHTDYNGGFVLPTPIPQQTWVCVAPRTDRQVRAVSRETGEELQSYLLGSEAPGRGWLDYVQGLTQALARQGFSLAGFELYVASDIPLGSGLSSSAALSVGLLRALRQLFSLPLDDLLLARLAQEAENHFVGAQVGIMDPIACHLGQPGQALFLDTRALTWEMVPLPAEAELVVLDSGIRHQHAAGDYNQRRAECQQACALLGIQHLRDLGLEDLPRLESLPNPWRQRARHVVTENARVLAAVQCLKDGNIRELGRLFFASHLSQRDDYEVSVPEIDYLVSLAQEMPEVYGARLTGGGFGGSVVLLAPRGQGRDIAERLRRSYAARFGHSPRLLVPQSQSSPL